MKVQTVFCGQTGSCFACRYATLFLNVGVFDLLRRVQIHHVSCIDCSGRFFFALKRLSEFCYRKVINTSFIRE